MAKNAGTSLDSVRRLEGGSYDLPQRTRSGGHTLELVLRSLNQDVCETIRACYLPDEIEASAFSRCLQSAPEGDTSSDRPTLAQFMHDLPEDTNALLYHGAMFNAHAMAFVISLERQFNRFEFLVTNQPPFMLFADDEYVMMGSASTELQDSDRVIYHEMIFEHRRRLAQMVIRGVKNYKIVLHQPSLIEFLQSRSRVRARKIVSRMIEMLKYPNFELTLLETGEALDEFEVLSTHYPFRLNVDGESISIRHRRIGVENTLIYQPAVLGARVELVAEDFARADALWRRGVEQCDQAPTEYAEFMRTQLPLRHKRITARLINDALLAAHSQ